MRLRKTRKRTASAVRALSMAVSAAALPASAGFNIDMSKVDGDVEITQVDDNGSAKVTIKVGGVEKTNDFSDGKEGNDVTITGDNTGDNTTPTESLNAEEENTSEAEKSGENTSEVEKTGEDTAEAEKTGKTEEQAQEPGSLELLARTADAGTKYGIPTLGVVAVGKDMERTEKFFQLATRVLAENGAHVVKSYYCDGFERVAAACPVPIVIAGGKKLPEPEALEMAYKAIQEGAHGVDMGRNIFQSDCPAGMAQAIAKVVHEGYTAAQAFEIYETVKHQR